jgi:hypothetical protein
MFRFLVRRSVFLVVSLLASLLGPFLWFNQEWKSTVTNAMRPVLRTGRTPGGETKPPDSSWRTELSVGQAESSVSESGRPSTDPMLVGQRVQNLGEVIRFDISPDWVTSRWGRVSTTRSESDLLGMRVPLVTGTRAEDLAGSLTYYFNKQHQVQRVSFDGYTGDPRPLAALVTQSFHLQPDPRSDGHLYLARWNGKPTSVLRIRHTAVVRTGAQNSQFEVSMEINRPGYEYRLSRRMQQQLAHEL